MLHTDTASDRMSHSQGFKIIDDALDKYYQNLGHSDYRDENGQGKFMQHIIEQELNDEDLPIETELGDDCNPNDCSYYSEAETYPIPPYVVTTSNRQIEKFMFYVMQYCYKHREPPTEQCKYI